MDLGITDKVALVTAGSKGLGLGSAAALATEGASVVISSRSTDHLQAAADHIGGVAPGAEVHTIAADMGDPDTPARLVAETVERFGAVDIAVANNGGPPPTSALEVTDDQVHAAIEANTLASIRLVQAVTPSMRERGWGRICCITSSSMKEPIPFLPLSNLARTALWAWAKTAADELKGDGITLNLACPGMHDTERIAGLGLPDDEVGDPGDFGALVAMLCSQQAAFMTGATLLVDGGRSAGLV